LSVLLDTHIWLWWLTGSPGLSARESVALAALAVRELPFIAAISIWEAQMLVSRGRLIVNEPFDPWIHRMTAPDTVRTLPLDADVVSALNALPSSFHGDPADRLIVATARAHALPLATHDRRIRRSRVATHWKP
jgi:PIN domain nuclease of toxin-antitoxin system